MCLSIGLIVWVIQAVNYLDFVTEDGHGLYVYFKYTILNFPKVIHRILPFVFFISIFYQLSKYENKNELFIFWANGVKKIQFTNIIILYSIVFTLFQVFLGSYISPLGQNEARSFIRSSNVDFFPSLIKEGKFIDTISDLTIFIESKDKNGVYKNIFLNEANENSIFTNKSQIIYAKSGVLVNQGKERYFKLYNGNVINKNENKLTNFAFDQIDFNLTGFNSKTTTYQKIQEVSSTELLECSYLNIKDRMEEFNAEYLQCSKINMKEINQEILKRFYKPIYLPIIGLICCILLASSKESRNYNKFKFFLFIFLFLIIIISEISLRYSTHSKIGLSFFFAFPVFLFFSIYATLFSKFNYIIK